MKKVQVERAKLDRGTVLMYRTFGDRVRLAYDPEQINESHALILLHLEMPQLATGSVKLRAI